MKRNTGATSRLRTKWLNQDPIGERGGINLYEFVANNAINQTDPLGLCDIKIRCGAVVRAGIVVGWHCGVIAPNGVEYGIGGAGSSGGTSGGPVPPVYPDPTKPLPPPDTKKPDQVDYAVSCPCKPCNEVQQAIQNYHDTVTPPPYNAFGPNSDTYAHNMLNAAGCKFTPIQSPPTHSRRVPPITVPPGTVGWDYGF
jgi:hypothetical protein